jgi:hypothetical protein
MILLLVAKNRAHFVALLVVLVTPLIASAGDKQTSEWSVYQNDEYEFTISYPSNEFALFQAKLFIPPRYSEYYACIKLVSLGVAPHIKGHHSYINPDSGRRNPYTAEGSLGIGIMALRGTPDKYNHSYTGSAIREVTFGGLTGSAWGFGVEGDGEDWYFFPLRDKNTLVVVRRYTSQQVGTEFRQWPSETMLSKILSTYNETR